MQIDYIDIHTHHAARASVRSIRNYSAIESPAIFEAWHSTGLHPYDVSLESLSKIDTLLDSQPVAIGEIGLDYAHSSDKTLQINAFERQVALAEQHRLPLIIHSVRALEDTLAVLRNTTVPVIIHGFTGHYSTARRFLDRGYYLSFGIRTMRSPKTIEVLKSAPRDRIFFETDDADIEISQLYTIFAELLGQEIGSLEQQTSVNLNTIFTSK